MSKLARKQRDSGYLAGRSPESPFRALQREMNHMFDNFWMEPLEQFEDWTGTFVPAFNLSENDKEVFVSAELPGMDEDDIELIVDDNALTIKGEKKLESEEEESGYYTRESSYGSFRRIVDLPAEVDQNKAEAKFKKGLLKVHLPKTQEAQSKTRNIEIKTG